MPKKTIYGLRRDVAAGRIGLQQCQTAAKSQPETAIGEPAGVGDIGGTDASASGEAIEYRILGIAEDAMMAAAQRDACVAAYQQAQTIVQQ